jgi:glycopeptide antibiotics resistance protein
MIDFTYSHLFVGIAILVILLLFFGRQTRSLWYLLFFSVFWIYLLYVVSVIVFPISPLPEESWRAFRPNINLIPFYFGSCDTMPELCLRGVIENVLLTMPFGFGISFITRVKSRDLLWLAPLVGIMFEAIQFIVSLMFRSPFRVADINDVILNAAGTFIGYGIFRIFGWLYVSITQNFGINNQYVFAYIYEVVRPS